MKVVYCRYIKYTGLGIKWEISKWKCSKVKSVCNVLHTILTTNTSANLIWPR